jgi:hypothetical protein
MKTTLALFIAATSLVAQTGALTGQVTDERQRPIHGARVDISALPRKGVPFQPFQASVLTGTDGSFRFAASAGDYRVCVQLPKSDLLDPCLWAPAAPSVSVTAAQASRMPTIVLKRGYPLTLQFVDKQGALSQAAAEHSQKVILASISALNGMPYPIPVHRQDPQFREHTILVPRDMDLTISIYNKGFDIADSKGVAVAAGSQPFSFHAKIAGERHPRLHTFYVNGLHLGN